jgi:hypothetical protein
MRKLLIIIFIFLGCCENGSVPTCKGIITPELVVLESTYGIILNIRNTGTCKITHASVDYVIHFSSKTDRRNAYCNEMSLDPGESIEVAAKIYPPSDNGDKFFILYDQVYDGEISSIGYLIPKFTCDYQKCEDNE